MEKAIKNGLDLALSHARLFQGATSPNPPVGAVGLDDQGAVLSVAAHEKAGSAHAEAKVLQECREKGLLQKLHTLIITLEPCNHSGRTPPCTEAILQASRESPLKTIFFGCQDPNPRVAGMGAARLSEAGLQVTNLESPDCRELIGPFSKWILTGLPWITLKTAYNAQGSMIPPPGQKTFSSRQALEYAHQLRRVSDAILTGSGTVLADLPEFTVRHVADHPEKKRWLAVMDRRHRTPLSWIQSREALGFQFYRGEDLDQTLAFLGSKGVLEVLVEAGPALTETFLSRSLWDRHVVIKPEGVNQLMSISPS